VRSLIPPATAPNKGRVRPRLFLLLLGAIALASAAFLRAGHYLEEARREPVAADLIVSSGGDWGGRAQLAAELYRRGFAPRILLAGADTLPPVSGKPVLGTRRQVLARLGIPPQAILMEGSARNTRDEAARARRLMQANGWRRVLVISDPPHMRRLALLWEREFEGSGLQFVPVAAPMENWDAMYWWRNPWSAQFVRTEYLKLAHDLLVR